MLIEILAGVGAGIITGLIPGIHVNLIAVLLLSFGFGASAGPTIVALAITHTFLDVIPAILLGAPEADTALGVLPGHRYLLKGWGYMAIKLTIIGSFFGLLIAFLLTPLWLLLIRLYPYIVPVLGYLLLAISAYMILRDRHKIWSFVVYGLSGLIGLALLKNNIVQEPLFPLFSGLFGVATLGYSLTQKTHVPPQTIEPRIKLRVNDTVRALGAGNAAGFLTSMLPGLGAAQAAVFGMHLARKVGDHGFLVLLGTVSTVNFSLSLLTWLVLGKARNGAVVALQKIVEVSWQTVALFFGVALIAGSLAVLLCLVLSRGAIHVVKKVPYEKMSVGVILFIVLLVGIISGWRGLYVLLIASAIGIIPAIVKCSRAHAMGCLLLPVSVWFL